MTAALPVTTRYGSLIRELPGDERPRERLLRSGPAALSENELVAVLLRTGRPGASALELARELLSECGGLQGLPAAAAEDLKRRGLGPAKCAVLQAAVEIGRRMAKTELPSRDLMSRPEMVARYLNLRYSVRGQEMMGALYLDTRNRLLAERELFRGTLNRAAVEPRAILKLGLLCDAAGLVLFHTHPSGDPAPSIEDMTFTRRLAEAADVIGVRLVDHLILGHGGRWVSLRRRGGW